MNKMLQETIIQLLGIIIGGALSVASSYCALFVARATKKIKIEIEKLDDEKQVEILKNTMDKVDILLTTNIIALEETVKKDMLASIEDGSVEKSELKNLATNVRDNVLKQLGDNSLKILNESLGDVNGYLEAKIEEILKNIKNK